MKIIKGTLFNWKHNIDVIEYLSIAVGLSPLYDCNYNPNAKILTIFKYDSEDDSLDFYCETQLDAEKIVMSFCKARQYEIWPAYKIENAVTINTDAPLTNDAMTSSDFSITSQSLAIEAQAKRLKENIYSLTAEINNTCTLNRAHIYYQGLMKIYRRHPLERDWSDEIREKFNQCGDCNYNWDNLKDSHSNQWCYMFKEFMPNCKKKIAKV